MEYYKEVDYKNTIKIREVLDELPSFVKEFFRGIAETTSTRTRLGYVRDLKIFFHYLVSENIKFQGKSNALFTIDDLKQVSAADIDEYLEYLTYYTKRNKKGRKLEYYNYEKGKSRKLASVRSMLSYFYKRGKINANPGELIDTPKIHLKNIVRLELDEIAMLLDYVDMGKGLNERQSKWHEYTRKRDLAIITLLLGTGIRVSECVGLNIKNVDFKLNGIHIKRKGGDEVEVYFGDEVRSALKEYIEERETLETKDEDEQGLFLSMQKKRITERAIQKLVKKYSQLVIKTKKISPHKLRSTYGTTLYRETGDIYMVADVLGHKDVNTTKKHYAEIDDNRRRKAGQIVKLRKD